MAPTSTAVPTTARWFVARNREKLGPFTRTQLQQMAASGQLQPDDMLLEEGQQKWRPAREVEGVFPVAVPVAVPAASVGDSASSGGRWGGPGRPRSLFLRLAVLAVPCLLVCCLLGGLLVYFVGSGGDGGTAKFEELTVTGKYVKYPPGREGDPRVGRFHVSVVDKNGTRKTLLVNDSLMAVHYLPEDLFENVEVGKTYRVMFKGDKHHMVGLLPTNRPLDEEGMRRLQQRMDDLEKQVSGREKGDR